MAKTVKLEDDRIRIEWHVARRDEWFRLLNRVKSLPDREFRKRPPHWFIPATPFHARQVIQLLEPEGFDIAAEIQEIIEHDKRERGGSKECDGQVLEGVRPYQLVAVSYLCQNSGRAIVGDDVGLGKSIEALGFVYTQVEIRRMSGLRILVVAPANVVYKWSHEILDPHARFPWSGLFTVGILEKTSAPMGQTDFTVVSYDILRRRQEELELAQFGCVILDEFHYIKSPAAARTKAARAVCKNAPYVIGLSGTPLLNRPIEMFTMLNILDPKQWPSRHNYGMRYCGGADNFGQFTGASNLRELRERLKPYMIRRLKQDVLPELPPIQVSILPIVVDTSQYREIERNVQKQILALSPTSKGYWMSVLDKLNYLRQASGIAKIPAAVEWAKDFLEENDGKLVIYAHHKRVGKELVAALAAFGADTISGDTPPRRRDELARCFRAEASPRVLVVTAAGGVGIDLFGEGRDCSNIIFVELEWRPSDFAQAWGRLHRFNQTNSVNAWILQARGTLDTYMTRRVDDKAAVIDEIMGDPPVIKEIVREWRGASNA